MAYINERAWDDGPCRKGEGSGEAETCEPMEEWTTLQSRNKDIAY